MKKYFNNNLIVIIVTIFLMTIMSFLLIKNAKDDSATTDEPIHILSGYSYWQGIFSINPEHPPLGKQIATLPLKFIKPFLPADANFKNAIEDYYYDSWQETRTYAQKWLYSTVGNNPDEIVFSARMAVVIFAIILGFVLFFTASKWYGKATGIIAVFIYAFSPLILTHGHLANTDLWMTLGFFISVFSFAWYLEKPKLIRMIFAAIFFALAMLFKFSAVILIPTLILLWVAKYYTSKNRTEYNAKKFIAIALSFLAISCFLIWADYGFPKDTASKLSLNNQYVYTNKILLKLAPELSYIPVPQYFKGMVMVFSTNLSSRPTYILGNFFQSGVWYYFPVAFLFKEPLSFIILLFGSVIFLIYKRKKLEFRDYLVIIPVCVYFLVALFSKLNIGIRHIMPIYPFLFILVGYFVSELYNQVKKNRILLIAYCLLLTALFSWYLYANISIYPYYMTYFNELTVGGIKNGNSILTDSNVDWGQDTKRLSEWLKSENIQETIKMKYDWSGSYQPKYYGINFINLEANDPSQKGWIAIGLSDLQKPEFSWLKNYQPVKVIGNSVFVYHIE
jgi:hypothetical protein